MKNIITGAIALLAILGALAFFGLTPFGKQIVQNFGTTTQGGTGQTARQFNVYGVNLAVPGANATSSSIQNNTGNDLYVTGIKAACEGVGTSKTAYLGTGLASLTVAVGTSSSAAPATTPTNAIATETIATGTVNFILASSTNGEALANGTGIFPAGSFMTFFTNATNTAVCTFGVDVTSS